MSKTFEVITYSHHSAGAGTPVRVEADSFNIQDGSIMFHNDLEPVAYFSGVLSVRLVTDEAA